MSDEVSAETLDGESIAQVTQSLEGIGGESSKHAGQPVCAHT